MEKTIKLQLIVLMQQGSSYSLLRDYFYLANQVQSDSFALSQDLLSSLDQHQAEIRDKQINFRNKYLTQELVSLYQSSLSLNEEDFPHLWREIPNPPIIIYYQGNLSLLKAPMVSVIGSRKTTPYGQEMARVISQILAKDNMVIVSGLAAGIDSLAHQGAIQAKGQTIAILPVGYEIFYPQENQLLQKNIAKNHLLISEYLPQQGVRKHQFIMRNRLVAGLTRATIVVEAAKKSGSLITANYALQYDRQLFALVGRLTDSQSVGCNELIYAGAIPIVNLQGFRRDLLEIFSYQGI